MVAEQVERKVQHAGSLREDVLGLLRDADAARTRVITPVTAQLMEYFQESGSSLSQLRETSAASQ